MRRLILTLLLIAMPALAPAQRLPLLAAPEHYDLRFLPDLQAERFAGRARIRVHVLTPTERFVLNAAELTVQEAAVEVNGRRQPAAITLDASAETLTLVVPDAVAPGAAELEIIYSGVLNRALRGFYISEANNRKYAVTQLEATDARRMFPSFDEPGFKATFGVSVVIDDGDYAISNGPIVSTSPGPTPGTKTLEFATTARMSAYLVALAIGDFECAEASVGDTPVRICATPGNRRLVDFAVEATRAILGWFNDYFAVDYPFQKLDLVAIPDFAAGAMENTGAVFFRESLLLVADDASLAARKRAALVIAHELAHQWFGNLVTMQWWDDLWLNEGFATWMETKAVAAWKPDWNLEIDELQATHGVMALDALRSTRAVRTRAETAAEIGELFDPIAYEKGAALLGMLESYVGATAFRGGVNAYLHEHQYDNATTEEFWTMMARATGKPADLIMQTFVQQPGVPLVTIETACHQGDTTVTLSQERFLASAAPAGAASALWAIPVCLETRGDGHADRCELLTNPSQTVTLPGCNRWVMGNKDAEGYYRTRHGQGALERLRIANAELDPDERLALVADQWALLRAGRVDAAAFLDAAAALALDVNGPGVLEALGARLQFLREYVAADGSRAAYEAWIRREFTPALEALSRTPPQDEDRQRRLALTLALVGGVGRDEQVLAESRRRVEQYLDGGAAVPATVLNALVPLAALTGGERLYERYLARAEKAVVPEDRYRFLYALASFREPALLRRTMEYALSAQVRAQDRAGLIASVLGNPAGREIAWAAVKANWAMLQDALGAFGGTGRIVGALGAFCDLEMVKEVRAFFEAHPVPGAERTLEQALEDIEQCATLRRTQAVELDAWLAASRPR